MGLPATTIGTDVANVINGGSGPDMTLGNGGRAGGTCQGSDP
jgi:hypothetical protein